MLAIAIADSVPSSPTQPAAAPDPSEAAAPDSDATTSPGYEQIVVVDLQAKDVSDNLASNLNDVLLSTVRAETPGASVLAQSELQSMLELEQTKQLIGCSDDMACWAEIGGALGAGHLITGSVGKIGSVFLVNLKLINTLEARVERHVSDRISGDEEKLISAVVAMTRHLLHGEPYTANALAQPVPPAVEEPKPWYQTWWVWTIVGVVVAGGATVAVVAATADGGGSGGERGGGVVLLDISPNGLRVGR